jgi:hypothetical protein
VDADGVSVDLSKDSSWCSVSYHIRSPLTVQQTEQDSSLQSSRTEGALHQCLKRAPAGDGDR